MHSKNKIILIVIAFVLVGGLAIQFRNTDIEPGPSRTITQNREKFIQGNVDLNDVPLKRSDTQNRRQKTLNERSHVINTHDADLKTMLHQSLHIPNSKERKEQISNVALRVVDTMRMHLALELMADIETIGEIRIFMEALLSGLLEQDPDEAAIWVSEFSDNWDHVSPTYFVDIMTPIITAMSEIDMENSFGLINQMENTENREKILTKATQFWIKEDMSKAADWVDQFPVGEHRNKALFKVGFQWSQADTATAAQWIQGLPEDEGKDKAIEGLVNIWTSQDPHAAANWAIQLPDPYTRDIAVSTIIEAWTYRNPKLVSDWITTFPPGELRMDSFKRTIELWAQYHPESAKEWLESIDDEELQQEGFDILRD